jgi:hypothetical protein
LPQIALKQLKVKGAIAIHGTLSRLGVFTRFAGPSTRPNGLIARRLRQCERGAVQIAVQIVTNIPVIGRHQCVFTKSLFGLRAQPF